MIYLFFGNDSFRITQKLNELLDFFKSKSGEIKVYRIEKENFNKIEFEELMKSKTLFENKIIVVCGGLLEEKNLSEFIMENFVDNYEICPEKILSVSNIKSN